MLPMMPTCQPWDMTCAATSWASPVIRELLSTCTVAIALRFADVGWVAGDDLTFGEDFGVGDFDTDGEFDGVGEMAAGVEAVSDGDGVWVGTSSGEEVGAVAPATAVEAWPPGDCPLIQISKPITMTTTATAPSGARSRPATWLAPIGARWLRGPDRDGCGPVSGSHAGVHSGSGPGGGGSVSLTARP